MTDVFYVKANDGSLVPANFFSYNGKFVKDPNLDG